MERILIYVAENKDLRRAFASSHRQWRARFPKGNVIANRRPRIAHWLAEKSFFSPLLLRIDGRRAMGDWRCGTGGEAMKGLTGVKSGLSPSLHAQLFRNGDFKAVDRQARMAGFKSARSKALALFGVSKDLLVGSAL